MAGLSFEPVAGWGRHPVAQGTVARPERLLLPPGGGSILPRGLGRSYGDAAVPAVPGTLVLETARADRVLAFDRDKGTLTCEAGLSLAEILRVFLPRGWFPPVTPGTRFVTVGGCVACDVHGKNHHRDGSFGGFVDRLAVQVADGSVVECGPQLERELFLATVGGMGLTGLITEVTLRLQPVESGWILAEAQPVPYDGFFYPLDGIAGWNRLYGRRGFLQYQCVVPRAADREAVAELLDRLAAARVASFLAVIKDCGPESDAYLSFPLEGTTLALDLPYRGRPTETLVHELNATVIAAGGRVYLAKDAVTRAEDFAAMTPRLSEWRRVRDKWDPGHRFRSAQSVRVLGDAP